MSEIEKFTPWRQRKILTDIADTGAAALNTAEGAAFIEQLYKHLSPSLSAVAKSWGYHVDDDEIVNMIIERVLSTRNDSDKCPVRYAAGADDPWGYLWQCARRWAQEMWGTRGLPLEYAEFTGYEPFRENESTEDGTTLKEVVDSTLAILAQVIDPKHVEAVSELLWWIAINPPQRLSYEVDDRVAAHRHCPSLTIEQVVAVIKIARGSRHRTEETSLFGQFLKNAEFRFSDSGSHTRALTHFKNAFRAGERGSLALTEWI
ncbi:hypothetical protein ACFWHR_12095 [Leucobacter sp. NPDC058333]|uniref:hypothetical protein n=1 Tax=Leucobacter sp. NPDC058333 TaxID=3346450 RepID=UPI00364ACC40